MIFLEDIFALQDEITTTIVSTLPARIEAAADERVSRKPTENMAAYEYVIGQSWVNGWCEDPDGTWRKMLAELKTTLALDDNDADVHRIFAAVHITGGDHERAAYHQERGLALNPNYDLIVTQQGDLLTWLGRPLEGIEWIRKAMKLNPHFPERFWNHRSRSRAISTL